jgi:uncharacterized protein
MSSTTPPSGPTLSHRLRRRLGSFAVLCVGITWVPWILLAASGADVNAGSGALVFALAAGGPTLAALAMWLWHRRELPRRRVRLLAVWPFLAVLLGAAPMLLVTLVLHWGELGAVPLHAAEVAASVGGLAGVLAYTFLAGPLAEEFGWRGYVQPRLRTAFGRLQTAMLLGTAWALWHLPLFFLDGTGQHEIGLLTFQGALFFLNFLPLSYVILFAYEHLSGGVWAAVLIHAAWNASYALLPPVDDTGQVLRSVFTLVLAVVVAAHWRAKGRGRTRAGAGLPVHRSARPRG